jgi:hypothetical protein
MRKSLNQKIKSLSIERQSAIQTHAIDCRGNDFKRSEISL